MEAMTAALEEGGQAAGILSQGVKKYAQSRDYCDGLMDSSLVLAASVAPEAPFHVGTAMGRNKYLYALADYAVVVSSDEKGGTWTWYRGHLGLGIGGHLGLGIGGTWTLHRQPWVSDWHAQGWVQF